MCDLIDRHEAIKTITSYNGVVDKSVAKRLLLQMPSAEPRKKGEWIPQNMNKSNGMISTAVYYYPKCSVCGWNSNYTNFCPNCGADMREGEEE